MHSTPVSMARPKLANSSPCTSASPISSTDTPGGRLLMLGSFSTAVFMSPSAMPASSTSKLMLRERS
ncbi:hypothetical protein D9M68_1001560 [compost metagenome]